MFKMEKYWGFMGFMGSELWLVRANAYIVRSPENFQMFDQFNSTLQPVYLHRQTSEEI